MKRFVPFFLAMLFAVSAASAATVKPLTIVNGQIRQLQPNDVTSVSNSGPAWATYSKVFDANRFDINGFPTANEFGGNKVPIAQAFVGSISIPATSAAANHGSGLAGYAMTASTTQGGVGVFGFGGANAASTSAWGGNFMAANCPIAASCATNTGRNNITMYGVEIDTNIMKHGGGAPNVNARGLYIVGGSEIASSNPVFNGLEIDSPGVYRTPKIKWANDIELDDGSATFAISVGTSATGNNVGSMPVVFSARSASGATLQSTLTEDSAGNFVIAAPPSAIAVLQSGSCSLRVSASTNTQSSCSLSVEGRITSSNGLTVSAGLFNLAGYTVATLPTCNSAAKGAMAHATDLTAVTYNAAPTGGGTNDAPVYCNGAGWTVH